MIGKVDTKIGAYDENGKPFFLQLKKSQCTIHITNKIPLLNALETHGFSPDYQCRSGFCGVCRTRIYQGKVRYLTYPLAHLAENEILLCCCIAESDMVLDK